ncbi:MAG: methionyl aminopeptidase [Planctomycetota bacterium]|nr:MAG: methionyl aminopeptidase [Planctomycetota bacterium]
MTDPQASPSKSGLLGVARAGRVTDAVLSSIRRLATPGMTTADLDRHAAMLLSRCGAESALRGYQDGCGGGPFPASVAICINNEVMGASDRDRILRAGDLITADLAVRFQGWYADAAVTWTLGDTPQEHQRLADGAQAACAAGIRAARPGVPWTEITRAIWTAARDAGLVLLRGYDAHGIGSAMHQGPRLPMHPDDLFRLDPPGWTPEPGSIITIEPVVASRYSGVVRSGWLDRTADGSPATFFEATIAVGVSRNLVLAGRCWWPGWNDLRRGGG